MRPDNLGKRAGVFRWARPTGNGRERDRAWRISFPDGEADPAVAEVDPQDGAHGEGLGTGELPGEGLLAEGLPAPAPECSVATSFDTRRSSRKSKVGITDT